LVVSDKKCFRKVNKELKKLKDDNYAIYGTTVITWNDKIKKE